MCVTCELLRRYALPNRVLKIVSIDASNFELPRCLAAFLFVLTGTFCELQVPWPTVQSLVEPTVLTVNDEQIKKAMHFMFRCDFLNVVAAELVHDCCFQLSFCVLLHNRACSRMKLVVEPAAATGLAALFDGQVTLLNWWCLSSSSLLSPSQAERMGPADDLQRIGVVVCGGNIDADRWLSDLSPTQETV